MSDTDATGEAPRRRMTRCPEGHIFDAASHELCPRCGAPAVSQPPPGPGSGGRSGDGEEGGGGDDARRRDVPPPPRWLRPTLLGGGALVVALLAFVMLRGTPSGTPGERSPRGTPSAAPDDESSVRAPGSEETPTGDLPAERWQTVMAIGGRRYVCVNETQADGRYRLGDGCPFPFAGETGTTVVNPDGSWTSRADNGRIDAGTIEFVSEDKFIAHTRGGPVVWERVKP